MKCARRFHRKHRSHVSSMAVNKDGFLPRLWLKWASQTSGEGLEIPDASLVTPDHSDPAQLDDPTYTTLGYHHHHHHNHPEHFLVPFLW
ncbi:hypothetical protein PoB_001360400 [Plakobranchus ocellatus]|uniref:Uncharacterized protein n=1 Tax=Plakobranchus ocellatus TaxID=259542 RepID=A0AAV3YZA3_9GAST|nr:hypothetical protein PoB_001360400 [Plakobranchus ocellatus]